MPVRVRLTLVFALATLLVLAGAGAFVHVRLRSELNEAIDETLERRAAAYIEGDPEDTFIMRTPGDAPRLTEREVAGFSEPMRILTRDGVTAGESVGDRDETLRAQVTAFAVASPLAVLLASLLGYGMAAAALRPVETLRRRAEDIELDGDERLPIPRARDEVRRLAETLDAMLERLRAAHVRERGFVADASHELRTPIATVRAELETAWRTGDPEAVAAALAETERLARLANDLLGLAGAAERVRPETLDARALLEGFAAPGVVIDALPGSVLHADPLRVRQVVGNLLDNARLHGSGTITVRARDDAIEVTDEGPGFPAGLEPFERFTRGDAARGRGGAGLGLALVRAIAEAHGGAATAHGSTVRVTFPSG